MHVCVDWSPEWLVKAGVLRLLFLKVVIEGARRAKTGTQLLNKLL